MDKKDFSNLGEEIKYMVQDAVNTMDFKKLNNDISNSVNSALDEVRKQLRLNQGSNQFGQKKMPGQDQTGKKDSQNPNYSYKNPNQNTTNQYTSHFGQNMGYQNQQKTKQNFSGTNPYGNNNTYNKQRQWNPGTNQTNTYQGGYRSQAYSNYHVPRSYSNQKYSNPLVPITSKPAGRISGVLFTVFGSIGTGVFTLTLFFSIIASFFSTDYYMVGTTLMVILPFLIASFGMLWIGIRQRRRVKRFKQYVGLIHGRTYCSIKELSSHMGQSDRYIAKDLMRMVRLGMFPQGHIDEQQTCFMLNHDTYQQYLKAQEGLKRRQREEIEQKRAEERRKELERKMNVEDKKHTDQKQKDSQLSPEVKKAIEEGRNYIKQINEANSIIPGEEISQKLERMERITSKIFSYVEQHPEQLPEIHKFMEYYLPTTLKLVNAYQEFDSQPIQGENITTAKNEIQNTLDTINLAFEKLLDSLFEDAAMDISTDISVMKTMMAQEGLTEKDFDSLSQ